MKKILLIFIFSFLLNADSIESTNGILLDSILNNNNRKSATTRFYDNRMNVDSIKETPYNIDENYLQNPFAIVPFGKLDANRTFKDPPKQPKVIIPKVETPKVIESKPITPPKEKPKKSVVLESIEVAKPLEPLKDNYADKLRELYSLRYEVFSLKQQLGDSFKADIPYGNIIDSDSSYNKFNTLAQGYNDAQAKSGFFGGINIGFVDIYTSGCANMRDVENPQYTPGGTAAQTIKGCDITITQTKPFVFGGNGGYQRFFNHYIGTRLWGGVFSTWLGDTQKYNLNTGMYENATTLTGKDIDSYYALAHMSADILFEFPLDSKFKHYIGAFIGINIGVMYYRPYIRRDSVYVNGQTLNRYYPANYIWNYNLQVDYSLNLGFNLTISNKNRIEFGLFVPLAFLELPGFKEVASDTAKGTESDIYINPQNPTTPQPIIGTPQKPDFWRSSVFNISFKRKLF
ncbi:outer membrane beta-barrel protein [Helicobacter saguini]|uniref:Outer membrane beta-barrel protein n=1 Tax=Helicobacter saguini TaxID=1548018 RepID=A0A347VM00_9HELI|nr:outer membrane beta-barrel protein [Helicobacter saguini]MWV61771.1 outer membrane beta-barrel protein [Helicobacter saguini]MWV67554.1 outer membrane beta-barrel protein [Helicobacter saguini]MWV69905.1 outer membrane beta-barrel protein [Helicobacter saguini]MWV72878.1 outer membrane beta-barrel protein [Helicobacter saguini]TLD93232.1 outer membrane beta-barrel protein [Helicobacter saguini]